MTYSIFWMVLYDLELRRRPKGRNTVTLLWSLHDSSCPNIPLKLLHRSVCISFQHISLILSWSCNHATSGTREWFSILRTRFLILPNTKRHFWSMERMNPMPNIDNSPSINPNTILINKIFQLRWLLDVVNLLSIHMICLVMMKNT